jgi:hypothetical protein
LESRKPKALRQVFSEEHDDDFIQAGTLVREIVDDEERKRLVETLVDEYEP